MNKLLSRFALPKFSTPRGKKKKRISTEKAQAFDLSKLFKLPGVTIESSDPKSQDTHRKKEKKDERKHKTEIVSEAKIVKPTVLIVEETRVVTTASAPVSEINKVVPSQKRHKKSGRPFILRFGTTDQTLFAKRLAMILKAGIPILEGLHMVSSQAKGGSATYIYRELIAHVEGGQPLSTGLKKFERHFGEFSINIVRVGESSGTLHENLNYLAEELKKKEVLKKRVIGALVYPAVVMVATFGISTILTVYIFPKIAPIFQSFKTTLPLSTRILIAISNFLLHDGLYLLGAIVLVCVGYVLALRSKQFHLVMDRVLLRLPLFGKLSLYFNLANTARTLGLLLKSDLGIVNALEIVSDSTRNLAFRAALEDVKREVTKGQKMSTKFAKYPRLFPPLMTQMVTVGEQTGNLTGSLMYLSDMYEEEISDLTKNMTTMLEPALMIVMGVIVGFIAISIITPIYGITSSISTH